MASVPPKVIPTIRCKDFEHALELIHDAQRTGEPILIREFWSADLCSPWSSSDFLRSQTPGNPLITVFTQDSAGDFPNSNIIKTSFHEFLAEWERRRQGPTEDCQSSTSLSIYPDVFCGNEHIINLSQELQDMVPRGPFDGIEEKGRLWIGNKGHVSHLHFDGHHGLLGTLSGLKHVTLYSPLENLGVIEKSAQGNHAARNPLKTPLNDCVSMIGSLYPGDALFIPVYWWHLVACVEDSVAINYWSYPDIYASRLKFGPLWSFTTQLCQRIVLEMAKGSSKFALLTEKNARAIVDALLRGKKGNSAEWEELILAAVDKVRSVITSMD